MPGSTGALFVQHRSDFLKAQLETIKAAKLQRRPSNTLSRRPSNTVKAEGKSAANSASARENFYTMKKTGTASRGGKSQNSNNAPSVDAGCVLM